MISELVVLFLKNLQSTYYVVDMGLSALSLLTHFILLIVPVKQRTKLRYREVKCFASYHMVVGRIRIQTQEHWVKSLYSLLLYSSCFHAARLGFEG